MKNASSSHLQCSRQQRDSARRRNVILVAQGQPPAALYGACVGLERDSYNWERRRRRLVESFGERDPRRPGKGTADLLSVGPLRPVVV